ncbi:MAG: hypothetical protein WDA71_13400 [Actinomycetota bacterium]
MTTFVSDSGGVTVPDDVINPGIAVTVLKTNMLVADQLTPTNEWAEVKRRM